MALFAILSELVIMHILVAISAVSKCDPRKFLNFLSVRFGDLMAFRTIDRLMLTQQWVLGFLMVETQYRLECVVVMAQQAIGRKIFLMKILVTVEAGRSQTQIGSAAGFL